MLEVLDPLEVGHDHAAGVRHHVRDHEHARVVEDVVGGRRGRAVGALEHDPARDPVGVAGVDHAAERARHEHVARHLQQLVGRDRLDALALELRQPAALLDVLVQRDRVDPDARADRAVVRLRPRSRGSRAAA